MKYILLVGLLICSTNFSLAEAKMTKSKGKSVSRETASDDYAAILKKYNINPKDLSMQILEDDKEIFSVNPTVKKIPASITKLFTAFAVLKKLSLGQRFYTKLYSDGNNLYLQGGGDPSFVSESMWFLVNELTRSDIKSVGGNIVVDDSLFDTVRYDDSRQDNRVDRAYDSPVGAMSFNWNAVNIFIRPGVVGGKAKVKVDPDHESYDLVNNTNTTQGPAKKELAVTISNTEKLITVSGDIQTGSAEKAVYKGIAEPDLWSGENLIFFLEQRGINVAGRVVAGRVPTNAELVATYESKSLAYILSDMNKFSNNFVAEMLVKQLAAQEMKTGASLKKGVEMIYKELEKIGIKADEVAIISPSGLNRENAFAAATLNKVLMNVKNNFSIFPTFIDGLPIAGIDGTMKKRMKGTAGEGWVRAKTGYLDGAISLAGFAGKRDGKILTFTFLYNGPRDFTLVQEAFDQIVINSIK